MTTPTTSELALAFELAEISERPLTPWASVHRAHTRDGRDVCVKQTATSADRATAMADWTRALHAADISVVTPVDLPSTNPRQVGENWWVAYPFIEGRAYTAGDLCHIRAAGDLLGRLHAAPVEPSVLGRLRPYQWPDTVREDVTSDLETLDRVLTSYVGDDAPSARAAVHELADRWWSTSLPVLRAAEETEPFPRTGVSSDYKVANLVFVDGGPPTLVDPDNGGLEPRLFDLAMAVVLFHNECTTAPGRLFTLKEWETFATAYLRHVDLTPRERDLWPAALDHMLWEEGSWALEDNDAEAWTDTRQGGYLRDLAVATPDRYPLPH